MLVRRDPKRRALVAPDVRSWACMSCSFDRPDGGTTTGDQKTAATGGAMVTESGWSCG